MTVSTWERFRRLRWEVTSKYRLSGVVTKKLGGWAIMAVRALDGVSPVRTPTVRSGGSNPSSRATSAISASGRSRFSWMSTARAFKGDT